MNRIAVLMPANNAAATIRIAVRSTLRALSSRDVLFVFNDASADATGSILKSIDDPRLRVLSSSENVGVARALNIMLSESSSKFVARMDADDVCLPHRFERQLVLAGRHDGVIFGGIVNFGRHARAFKPMIPVTVPPRHVRRMLLIENCLSHPTLFVRRNLMATFRGYTLTPAEDYELWLRLVASDVPIWRFGFPVIGYRRHQQQLTASAAWKAGALRHEALMNSYQSATHAVLGVKSMSCAPPVVSEVVRWCASDEARAFPIATRLLLRKCRGAMTGVGGIE